MELALTTADVVLVGIEVEYAGTTADVVLAEITTDVGLAWTTADIVLVGTEAELVTLKMAENGDDVLLRIQKD